MDFATILHLSHGSQSKPPKVVARIDRLEYFPSLVPRGDSAWVVRSDSAITGEGLTGESPDFELGFPLFPPKSDSLFAGQQPRT